MTYHPDDTIAALASAPGPAARGVIRISGPDVKPVLDALFVPQDRPAWERARSPWCHKGHLRVTRLTRPLPADVYFWPGRRSYTAEPMSELHLVGAPPLLDAVLSDLFRHNVRPARAGEFTLRAFLSGRIDLLQAEAVLGVVDAADHGQLERALRQLAGGISSRMVEVREDLLNLLAELEAGLDFVEEDIEFVAAEQLQRRTAAAREFVAGLIEQAAGRMQTTARARVVLAGLPNAGKSTLFNALAGRDAALVSHVRGTTRDYLSCPLDWSGTSVELIDTAGWQQASEQVARSAQSLLRDQLAQADIVLWCTAADLDEEHRRADDQMRCELAAGGPPPLLRVCTKADLALTDIGNDSAAADDVVVVSARTGQGLPELMHCVIRLLTDTNTPDRQLLATTSSRCRDSLERTADALDRADQAVTAQSGDEIIAIELREALEHLGYVVGAVYTDDILDRLFSKFCIGK